jgi:hypothetical protein
MRLFASLRLCVQFLFSSRKGAKTQRNNGPLGLASGGLGVFASAAADFFLAQMKQT